MKKRSRFGFVALMICFVMLFSAACSGNNNNNAANTTASPTNNSASNTTDESTPPVEVVEDKTPVTIKFANWAGSETYEAVNKAFTAKYPWITVETVVTGTVVNTVEESIAANDPIDVFFNGTFSDVVSKNLAEDLTPYIANDQEFQAYNFLPNIVEQYNVDSKQMALPRGTEAFLVYYNKDLMNELGIEKPALDWSWEDLRQLAIKATDPTKGRYGFGLTGMSSVFGWSMIATANGHAANPYMLNEDLTASVADQPDVLADLQWFRDLIDKDKVMLDNKAQAAAGVTEDLWVTGNALFTIHVSPLMENWKTQLKFNWDVLPFPKGTAKQVGLMWNQPLFMSKAGKHKDAVWKFIKFFTTSKEAQDIFLANATLLPNTPDASMKDMLSALPFYEKYDVDALLHAVSTAISDPTNSMVGGDIINAMWNDFHTQTTAEGISPYDFFPAAVEKANKDLVQRNAELK